MCTCFYRPFSVLSVVSFILTISLISVNPFFLMLFPFYVCNSLVYYFRVAYLVCHPPNDTLLGGRNCGNESDIQM